VIERDHDAIVREIRSIATIPSPTFDEEPRLAWLAERLSRSGGRVRRDGANNLIWSWGDGHPALLVTAHVDTVFPASTVLDLEQQGDWLVGPGVGDNAAAIAVVIAVVEALLRSGEPRPGAVAFTVCEEGLGDLRGARQACADLAPGAVIALEGHGLESVVADAHGSIRARVAILGEGGHAWNDRGRPSAVHELLRVGDEVVRHGTVEAPVNVGVICGGLSVNAIAASAELTVEKRCPDASGLSAFHELLDGLQVPSPLELTVEVMGERPAGSMPRDHPLLTTVLGIRRGLGLAETLESGSTDANAAIGLGIPAISLGVARGSDMHTLHEKIDLRSLELGVRQLELVLAAMLGDGG
jgi:tripeptide aminopeptidase